MANSINLNLMVGRLHDAAMEQVSKSAKAWFKFGTLRGANRIYIQNTAISYNGADKPSTFVGGNGPFKIIASKGTFTTTKMFIKLVSEYMKWFAGEGDFKLSEDDVKNAKGKVSGKRFFSFDYTIDYKTGGIERKAPPAPKEPSTDKKDEEQKDSDKNKDKEQSEENKDNEQSEKGKDNEQSEENKDKEQSEENKDNEQSEKGKDNEQSEENKNKDNEQKDSDKKNNEPNSKYGENIGDDTELIIASQIQNLNKPQINESNIETFITNIKNDNIINADINLKEIIKNKISSKFNNI